MEEVSIDMEISFSGDYLKLHGQEEAILVYVGHKIISDKTPIDFIEYDTKRIDGTYYNPKSGFYILLVFLGNKNIPFTTIRPWDKIKEEYYKSLVGKRFEIKRKTVS